MKKLEFNNLDLILEYIKNPEHKNVLFLLECAIREAKSSSKSEFKIAVYVLFTKIFFDQFSQSGAILLILTSNAASAIRKAIIVIEGAAIFIVADLIIFIPVAEEI